MLQCIHFYFLMLDHDDVFLPVNGLLLLKSWLKYFHHYLMGYISIHKEIQFIFIIKDFILYNINMNDSRQYNIFF